MVEASPAERDPFRPPTVPVIVHCLHCDQEYESYLIHWVEDAIESDSPGFWCCPTPGCDGKGFGFDIFPIDPDYRDEHGNLMWMEDDDDEDYDEVDEYVDREREVEDREVDAGRQPPVEDAEDDIPW
ncbi:MAG: hypothetical protein IIA64_07720 [Planctomycetes bacterium]|nr:hypothetical protein [Planctomycetota bacterium]